MAQSAALECAEISLPSGATYSNDARHDLVRRLTRHCNRYRGAITTRAVFQLASTVTLFAAIVALMLWTSTLSLLLTLPLAIPAAGLLVRLFVIQHDCGHGSFLKSRRANDMIGRIISVFTLTPYRYWAKSHATHHASSGNLTKRGIGDIDTLTIREYLSRPWHKRFVYRVYRNPVILLVIGAPLHFLLLQRIPLGERQSSLDAWLSVMGHNLAIAVAFGLFIVFVGFKIFAMIIFPVAIVSAWIGGWLFFVQHQFEQTHWSNEDEWDFHIAAIFGSSYYVLPRILNWFTGHIGLHHIHHLCSRIPNYRLQECLAASPELQRLNRLTIRESLGCVRLSLWDEARQRLVPFNELRHMKWA